MVAQFWVLIAADKSLDPCVTSKCERIQLPAGQWSQTSFQCFTQQTLNNTSCSVQPLKPGKSSVSTAPVSVNSMKCTSHRIQWYSIQHQVNIVWLCPSSGPTPPSILLLLVTKYSKLQTNKQTKNLIQRSRVEYYSLKQIFTSTPVDLVLEDVIRWS